MDWRQIPKHAIDTFLSTQGVTPNEDPYSQAYSILQQQPEGKELELPEQIIYWMQAYQLLQSGVESFDHWYSQSGLNYSTAVNIWYYTGLSPPLNYLNELPLELLYDIISRLDWNSLMGLCRLLYDLVNFVVRRSSGITY